MSDFDKELVVGIRGNPAELKEIVESEESDYISEVFVGAPREVINTGRFKTHPTDHETLSELVHIAHSEGIDLTVVSNAFCIGGQELDDGFKERFRELLVDLENMDADSIVLSHPILVEIASSMDINLKKFLSVYNRVTSPVLAKEYEEMGIDRIHLPKQINKDPSLVKRINDYVDIPLEIYVNSKCLNAGQCPYNGAHKCFKAHQRVLDEDEWDEVDDPYIARCVPRRKNSIFQVIYTPTVRPEDLYLFKEMGIKKFKIATRQAPPEKTLQLVKAYGEEYFDGPFGELWTNTPSSQTPHNRLLDGVFEETMDMTEEERYEYYRRLAEKIEEKNVV